MLVKLDSMANLADALEQATITNNMFELNKIVNELNSAEYSSHNELIKAIRKKIEELDPFEPVIEVNYILDRLKPELKKLMDPAHMILITDNSTRPKWFRCFPRTRT